MSRVPDPPATTLYLIRHGATDANQRRPYVLQGRGIDLPLNDQGRKQATAVAAFLQRFEIQAVYASTLQRSVETAEMIARPHAVEVQRVAELVECDVGRWEGLDWNSIMQAHPAAYQAFMENPATNPYLDGESYADVLARVEPELIRIMQRHAGQSIAVVAHNVVNRAYLASLLGLDLGKARELPQSNGCVNVIRHRNGLSDLLTLNAHFHLDGLL